MENLENQPVGGAAALPVFIMQHEAEICLAPDGVYLQKTPNGSSPFVVRYFFRGREIRNSPHKTPESADREMSYVHNLFPALPQWFLIVEADEKQET